MNKKNTVLIISWSDDIHSKKLAEELTERGDSVFHFKAECFALSEQLLSFSNFKESNFILEGKRKVNVNNIKSVLYRPPLPTSPGLSDALQNEFGEAELTALLEQLYHLMPEALWVNDPFATKRALPKLHQLHVAQLLGFSVPKTCMTNSPEEVRAFVESIKGQVIYKTISPRVDQPSLARKLVESTTWNMNTATTLLKKEYMENIAGICNSGGIFQEYIEKDYELRITVVDGQVFAAKIDSQKASLERDKVDSRGGPVYTTEVPVTAYDLPKEVEERCRKMISELNLHFGAFDMVKTPGGEYVFLELNSVGQWMGLEKETKQPISETMVKLLLRAQPTH